MKTIQVESNVKTLRKFNLDTTEVEHIDQAKQSCNKPIIYELAAIKVSRNHPKKR